MALIVSIAFIAVFTVGMIVVMAITSRGRAREKQIWERLAAVSAAARRAPGDERLNILRQETLSSVPFFDAWLREMEVFPKLRVLLAHAESNWNLMGVLLRCLAVGSTVGLLIYWRTRVEVMAVALGVLASGIPILYLIYKRSQRFAAFEKSLPATLGLLVRALRSGQGLTFGIELIAKEMPNPVGDEFRKCFEEQNYGLELRDALVNLTERVPIHDVHIIVTAILIQRDTGGNLAEVLDNVAHVIRERYRLRRQIRTHTAQGRISGFVLALLPIVMGVVLFLARPDYISTLWRHPTGLNLLYASAIMTLCGALVIRSIIRIRV